MSLPIHIVPVRLEDPSLDGYSCKGLSMSRDPAMAVLASLARDIYELRSRGGKPNEDHADHLDAIRHAMHLALIGKG